MIFKRSKEPKHQVTQSPRLTAEQHVAQARALDKGGPPEQIADTCERALAAYGALGTLSERDQLQVDLMARMRVRAVESIAGDVALHVRVLDDSVEIMRGLPATRDRSATWLNWSSKLITAHFEQGRDDEAIRQARKLVERLPGLGTWPTVDFQVVHIGMMFCGKVAVRVAEAGETELAGELVDRCVRLLGDGSSADLSEDQGLKITRPALLGGLKFQRMDLADPAIKLLAVAADGYRVLGGLRASDAAISWRSASCCNALAWELARRGDSTTALPHALEAVEYARSCVGDEPGSAEVSKLSTLAESLDTLATIRAQLGETDAALTAARESQALKRQLVKRESTGHAAGLQSTDKLVALIEQGATGGFIDR